MLIDPVVLLAEELRAAELALHIACKTDRNALCGRSGEKICNLTVRVKELATQLVETTPTSALGAGVLVRMAAERLPFAYAAYTRHLHDVAARLGEGQRTFADLVWLRAMRTALAGGLCGSDGVRIAPLLKLAIEGVRQPIVVYRAAVYIHDGNQANMDAAIQ